MNETITASMLEELIDGRLSPEDTETVLQHLTEDEESLAFVDRLWQQRRMSELDDIDETHALDSETADKVETLLINRIHRTDLTGQVVQLGTRAAGQVYWALLRPVVTSFSGADETDA